MDFATKIEKEFFPFINKPGRFTGNEYNVILKDLNSIKLRVVLAFPDIYELGMSYLGFDILYHVLNSQSDIWAERVYAPWQDAESVLREKNIPLFSLESRTPLNLFDWIGFTLQYELTYTNILNMMHLAGIPIHSKKRQKVFPLIIGGGPSACNPEPLADFFDAFLIGDGETAVLEISSLIIKSKAARWDKPKILFELSKITGVYIPSYYQPVFDQFKNFQTIQPLRNDIPTTLKKRILPELDRKFYPQKPLVPLIEVTHDRLSLEIMRGCSEGCRFCNAGMIYRPVRRRSVEDLLELTEYAIRSSGFDEVSLLSLNTSDYFDLNWLMTKEKLLLAQDQVKFTFPSLRLDALTQDMIEFVKTTKKTGFTFAPEAGSQRLRNIINKNIKEEDILNTLQLILDNGWRSVKFYFMIGLPKEKDEDLFAIINLLQKCRKIASGFQNVSFNLSVSPFSPKSHTPFQWEKQDSPGELHRKIGLLKQNLTQGNINLSWRDEYVTTLETIFAQGGRELADCIENAWEDGARFDGWNEFFNWERWESVFTKFEIDWKSYLRAKSPSRPLPWEHIDMGVTSFFLQQEHLNAYEGKISKDCSEFVCLGCGLQRKHFEKLVTCYKKQDEGKLKGVPANFSASYETKKLPTQPISYGRGSKRRSETFIPVKKKIRLRFTKIGLIRFISHLDIIRVFDRAARRAKIGLIYSQGFHPRPKFSFGPPLSLGIASLAEYLDLEAEISEEADFQARLNKVLPSGIKILQQKTIYSKVPALAAVINRHTYETDLEDFVLPQEWLNQWLGRDLVEIERITKGQKKLMNIRPFVSKLELESNKLIIHINTVDGRTIKVTEVLESLFGEKTVDYRNFLIQRTGQFIVSNDKTSDPFQVLV
jgi:radical SAM family uncharacterized protein/radical SAM-linked protein